MFKEKSLLKIVFGFFMAIIINSNSAFSGDGYWSQIGPSDEYTYHCMAIDPQNPNVFYTGSLDKSTDAGKTWQYLPDPFTGRSNFLLVHPKDSTLIYGGGWRASSIKRSNNGGITFQSISNGLPENTFYDLIPGKLAVHPTLTNVVFVAGENNVFKSDNQGDSWTKLQGTGLPSKATLDIVVINPKNPNIMYASSYGGTPTDPVAKAEYGVYKTEDGGDNWRQIWGGGDNNIFTLVIDPINTDTLYIGGIPGVWRSVNGGDTWVAANNGVQTPNDNEDILIHPIYHNIIYCSQDFGYYSTNAAEHWISIPKDSLDYMPSVYIGLLAIHPIENTIYAGGPSLRGIWSLSLPVVSNNPPNIISPSSVIAYEDSLFEYTARAIDPEESIITYIFQNYPSWLVPNDSTISGIPKEGTEDTSFVVIASDGELADTLLVEVSVILINDPPEFISPNAVPAYEDSLFEYTARAIDPEDSIITYIFKNYPAWLDTSDSTIYGIPEEDIEDTSFVVIASDGELTDTLLVLVTIVPVNDPPQIINISDFTFANTDTHKINLNNCVTDADHKPESMTWKIIPSNENLKVDIVDSVANFSAPNWSGETDVKFKVTDPEGASDSMTVKCSILITSVESFDKLIPKEFFLKQNYPNPFNPKTTISIGLPKPVNVKISIFNLSGQLVAEIFSGRKQAGNYSIIWNVSNLSAGTYFIKMVTDDFVQIKKCIILK